MERIAQRTGVKLSFEREWGNRENASPPHPPINTALHRQDVEKVAKVDFVK